MSVFAASLKRLLSSLRPERESRRAKERDAAGLREEPGAVGRSADEEVALRTRNLSFLYDFSKAVSYTLDHRQLVQRILEGISQVFDRGVCGFLLFEDRSAHVAVKSLSPEFDGCAAKVRDALMEAMDAFVGPAKGRRDISLSEIPREASGASASAGAVDVELRSRVNVPFIIRGETVGMINVSSDRDDAFSESDVELVGAIARDASAALERLRSVVAEEKLVMEAMVSSMAEGVILISEGGRALVCNPSARALLRLDEAAAYGEDDVSTILRRMGLNEAIRESDRLDEVRNLDVVIPGEERAIIRAEVAPVRDARGMPHGTVLVLRDVTKDVEIDHMKSEFISIVSHEIRTPLSLTREGLSLVLDGLTGEINERQQKCLTTARSNIDRLGRIVGDLLDVSKIESGKVELNRVEISMREVVSYVAGVFRKRATDAGIELKIELPEEDVTAYADHDRIVQVFTNLVGNALKFTEKGSIGISVQALDDAVECCVWDTGIGIRKEDMPHLFDRFRQFGRTHGPGDKGTGLGLSIAKGIMELHGGTISAHSAPGEGTRFVFTIPVESPDGK